MDKKQAQLVDLAVKALEEYRSMHAVDSPTFDLALALVRKIIETDKITNADREGK